MKILHVIPSVAPRYGGPSQAVYTMCRALQDRGTEVLIATTNADGSGTLPVALGEKIVYQGAQTIFGSPGLAASRAKLRVGYQQLLQTAAVRRHFVWRAKLLPRFRALIAALGLWVASRARGREPPRSGGREFGER